MSRYLHAQYCDDIRAEVGGKLSLMGVYAADLRVAKFPAVLPKFCVAMTVMTPIDEPLERLSVRLLRDDELIAEGAMPADAIAAQANVAPSEVARLTAFHMQIILSPFVLNGPCTLRVRADTESGELIGPGLRVDLAGE